MKPVIHLARYFVAAVGKTACGKLATNVTAYRKEATCRKCLRRR